MDDAIPIEAQALAVESAAVSYRAGVERHEELVQQRRWNPDLIPSEWRMAKEMAAAAETMPQLVKQQNTSRSMDD